MTRSREEALALDRANPLGWFAQTFEPARPGWVYLDGNSLGRPSTVVARAIARETQRWASDAVTRWDRWIELPRRAAHHLARHFLGADPDEVLVADSTTLNLYKLASAALDVASAGRDVIITDEADFPTDRYVLQGLARQRGAVLRTVVAHPVDGLDLDALADAVDERTAVVSLSHVDFTSGAMADMGAVNRLAHDHGALVLWDLSHSAGALPVDLAGTGADLAVGCTYKYLNAGPGAPAYLYVRRDLQAALRSPVWGWFGQRRQFEMGPDYDPADGVTRFLSGTPNILGTVAVRHAVRHLARVGIAQLRATSVALTELVVSLADEWLAPLGFTVASPRSGERRGGHVALSHPDAYRIGMAMRAAGVVPDVRPPDRLRLAPVPAYTRFVDVWDGLDRVRRLVEAGEHLACEPAASTVT